MPRLRLTDPLVRQLLAASLSGVLLFLANEPVGWWPLALVGLVPFLWALSTARPARGALIGWCFGIVYFGLLMYWILLFGELAWFGLACANSVAAILFGWLLPVVRRPGRVAITVLGTAALWTSLEYLRGSWPFGGLTWGDLAYTQAGDPALLPLAAVTGAWGVSFAVVAVNALLLEAGIRRGRGVGAWAPMAGAAVVIVLAPAAIPLAGPNGREVDVAMVQVPVPEAVAITAELEDRIIADLHMEAHRTLQGAPPELVVWAEDSLDGDFGRDPGLAQQVSEAIRHVGAPTLVGGIMGPPGGRQFNQGVLFDATGTEIGRTSKVHLVPFGEYVPFRGLLDFLGVVRQIRGDLTAGRDVRTLGVDGLRFGDVICYENAFPSIARTLVGEGAEFLTVTTNNSTYLSTAASRQHLEMSRLRAVEQGRWVVHAAVSGVSAFVDPRGRVHDETSLFEPAVVRRSIVTSTAKTPYARFGDWLAIGSLVASAWLILAPRPRRRPRREPEPLPAQPRTLVVLPTYNEAATIETVLRRLLDLPHRVDAFVVDDGSPDGTGKLVEQIAADEPRVRLLKRHAKSGLASAYDAGFTAALAEGYDLIVEMDSDLSHDPDELPALLDATADNDLVIGSRYVPGGSVSNWSPARVLLSKAGNGYARIWLGMPLHDATSGFRAFRRELLEYLLESGIHAEGYGFQIELAFRSWRDGFAVGEVPITFREREHGHSKISRRIVIEALWQVAKWGLRDRFRADAPPRQP